MNSGDRSEDTSSICCLAFIFALVIIPIGLYLPYVSTESNCMENEIRVNRNVCEDCFKYMPGCYNCASTTNCTTCD